VEEDQLGDSLQEEALFQVEEALMMEEVLDYYGLWLEVLDQGFQMVTDNRWVMDYLLQHCVFVQISVGLRYLLSNPHVHVEDAWKCTVESKQHLSRWKLFS